MSLRQAANCPRASHSTVAVIVTFNGSQWIGACLESLRAEGLAQIVIVDNASADDTVERARQALPSAVIIGLERNKGFGRANNIGIQKALDLGAQFICLINQDLTVEPGCIDKLARALAADERLGIVSALQLTYDGAAVDPIFRLYMPDRYWDDLLLRSTADRYDVDFIPAAAVAMPRRALLETGGFDPLFFMYAEDEDLCFRMRARNWKLSVVPEARVLHWHGFVNARRSFAWVCNLEYNGLLAHLKQSPRSMVLSFMSWFKRMRLPKTPAHFLARTLAFARCVALAPTIARHRDSVPFVFTAPPQAAPDASAQEADPKEPHAA
jgi:GT2 family glycosyltransferase